MPCYFCKAEGEGLKTLMKNALKLVQYKYKDVTSNDQFCNSCYRRIQDLLKRVVENKRLGNTQNSVFSSFDTDSSYSSLQLDSSTSTLDRLILQTPRNPQNQQTLREINATGMRKKDSRQFAKQLTQSSSSDIIRQLLSSESSDKNLPLSPEIIIRKRRKSRQQSSNDSSSQVRPIVSSDSDDDDDTIAIPENVPGPSSLANVQPLIKRRRTPIILTDESQVPIYRRSHVGG